MKSPLEMLRMSLEACGGACNDHDYICECRPVDVRRVIAEVERLRERLAEASSQVATQSGGYEEYSRSKHFRIAPGDVGSEAYRNEYVLWLEAQNRWLRQMTSYEVAAAWRDKFQAASIECERLRGRLTEYDQAAETAAGETRGDERHCACVPLLKREIKRLLETIAR